MRVKVLIAMAIASIVLLCSAGTAFTQTVSTSSTPKAKAVPTGVTSAVAPADITSPGVNISGTSTAAGAPTFGFPDFGSGGMSAADSQLLTELTADDFCCPDLSGFLPASIAAQASSDALAQARPVGVDFKSFPFMFEPAIANATSFEDLLITPF